MGNFQRLVQFGFAISAFCLVVAIAVNAASNLVRPVQPEASLQINPLNTKARLTVLATLLREADNSDSLERAEELSQTGLEYERFDARFYSIKGLLIEAGGDTEKALNYYQHARTLLPTEIRALIRQFANHVESRELGKAMVIADLVHQRWPNRWPIIEPFLPLLLSDDEAYQIALNDFPRRERGTYTLTTSLAKNPASLNLARRLLLDWRKAGVENLQPLVTTLNWALLKEGRNIEAYQLFQLTLSDEQKPAAKYIFNGEFDAPLAGGPFGWQMKPKSGVAMNVRQLRSGSQAGSSSVENALEIKFLNTPVDFRNVSQYLRLPATVFRLSASFSTKKMKGPRPLRVGIQCLPGYKLIAELELPHSDLGQDLSKTTTDQVFRVPDSACDVQFLSIYNENFEKSWSNKYSGSMLIHELKIELASDEQS